MMETVLESIFLQASATPDAIALVCGGRSLSYRSLVQRVERWAKCLRGRGIGPESIVGIALPQSEDLVTAVLATLRAGGAYLPLDRAWPNGRRREILRTSGAALLIADSDALHGDLNVAPPASLDAGAVPPHPMPMPVGRQLAYVIHTSGSTGAPKGVAIEHTALMNHMRWMVDRFGGVAGDRILQRTSCAFDASVWELFLALMAGGTLVLSDADDRRNPLALRDLLRREAPAAMQCVPTFLRLALDGGVLDATNLRLLFVGGEILPRELAERATRASGATVVNLYGPTETTIDATYLEADHTRKYADALPIGRPIPNVRAALVDRRYEAVSDGAVAELWIGGAGVARGYHRQPAQTALRFVPDPFAATPGQRAYRSGDLAHRHDGVLTFVGRADRQVKWHGFRVELGEIEAVLRRHPQITDAVVQLKEVAQTQAVVAYCLCRVGSQPDEESVKRHAAELLPHHMIPGQFVWLDKFPVKSNGKIDVAALPAAVASADVEAADVTGERVLTEIWTELFKRPVGVFDNFFGIGGDSIRCIQLISLANARGLTLRLQDIFECPSISALAARLRPAEHACEAAPFALLADADARRLDPERFEDAYPTTVLLDALFLLSQTSPRYEVYVTSCEVDAVWNAQAFRAALERVVRRHPWLRTSFAYDGVSRPLQLVHKHVPARWTFEDLGELGEDELRRHILSWIDREKRNSFEWSRAPVWRIAIHRTGAARFRLTLSEPVFDGWSVSSFLAEILEEYSAACHGVALPLRSAPRGRYRDFVAAEQSALADAGCVEFWRRAAQRNVGRNVPRLKDAQLERRGVLRIATRLSAELTASLRKIARAASVPLKTVLLAAHARVVGTLTGRAAVVSGVIMNGRAEGPETDQVLGLHINTVPLLFDLGGPKTWLDLIRHVFALETEALLFRRYPLAAAQKLHGSAPLFETAFNFTEFHRLAEAVHSLGVKVLDYLAWDQTFFPLTAQFHIDVMDGTLGLGLDYDSGELSTAQVERMADVYRAALEEIAADSGGSFKTAPQKRRSDVPCAREPAVATAGRVLEAVWRVARTQPDAIALTRGDQQISYATLVRTASALASELCRIGVAEQSVLVSFDTQFEVIIALLALFEAGGIYVPVDPALPPARIERVARSASSSLCLCAPECERRFRAIDIATLGIDLSALGRASSWRVLPSVVPGSAAYRIYTSGSTGEPKGVAVSHASLEHFLGAMSAEIGLSRNDVVPGITPIGFDISLMEMLLPLTSGARLVTIDREVCRDGERLPLSLLRSEATICQATPTTWRMLLEANAALPARLRALSGGEALPSDLAGRLLASGVDLWNIYGPTETTIWSAVARVRSCHAITLGAPVGATTLRLIDAYQNDSFAGVAGEIAIGGAGVAQYYVGNPALTAARFIPDERGNGTRMYLTGDYGRQTAGGFIEFLGRFDDQVKVRGYRIQLGEVETALRSCAGIRDAAVIAVGGDRPSLVGYVTVDAHAACDEEDLRRHLRKSLPEHMIPARVLVLDALPMTPNQKIDRSRLPAQEASIGSARRVAELFEQVKAMKSDEVKRVLAGQP